MQGAELRTAYLRLLLLLLLLLLFVVHTLKQQQYADLDVMQLYIFVITPHLAVRAKALHKQLCSIWRSQ
jgi:hypothetical protein